MRDVITRVRYYVIFFVAAGAMMMRVIRDKRIDDDAVVMFKERCVLYFAQCAEAQRASAAR